MVRHVLSGALLATIAAAPAYAGTRSFVLDHGDLILLILAVVGLIIGRQSSRPPVDPRP